MRVIVNGCFGQLGRVIVQTAQAAKDIEIAAGVDVVPPPAPVPFPYMADLRACAGPADVIVDASAPQGVPGVLDYALAHRLPLVVCTTGLPDETERGIVRAAQEIAVFKSANMSLGINLLMSFLSRYAHMLDESGFDIEIIEKHHNRKLDAPSGTALMLADAANGALGNRMRYVVDRTSQSTRRTRDEIGVQSIRGGTIVGEHTVLFAGRDEVIEVTHTAQSKEVFAVGALRAARYVAGQQPGLYNMRDLMGD